MSELNRLIHEPARLTLIAILSSVKEADFLYLLRETGLTKGNLSTHLVRLEEAGYVEIEKTFRGKIPLTLVRQSKEMQIELPVKTKLPLILPSMDGSYHSYFVYGPVVFSTA